MTVTPTRLRWAALRDGVAHAHRRGTSPRTLCDLPAIREIDAWPALRRCQGCLALEAELAGATEGELRLAWGGR